MVCVVGLLGEGGEEGGELGGGVDAVDAGEEGGEAGLEHSGGGYAVEFVPPEWGGGVALFGGEHFPGAFKET